MVTVSPSSAPERGQASPTAALVAVAAVGLGLSLYATTLAGVVPTADREVAEPTLSRVHEAASPGGVAVPNRLETAVDAGPTGWTVLVELRTDAEHWTAGPVPAPNADTQIAARRVPVRVAPGRVASGQLRVVVHR